MCKKAILFNTLFFLSLLAYSQNSSPRGFSNDKLFTGGGLGLQIGEVTLIDISPHIGYFFTERIALGIGASYQYYAINSKYYKYSTDIYGGRVFSRYYILEELFAHGEYEYLNYEAALIDPYGYFTGGTDRVGVDNVLLGGGYRQNIGGNSWINLMVLWNVNETVYTLYSNPIIRMGIDIGL